VLRHREWKAPRSGSTAICAAHLACASSGAPARCSAKCPWQERCGLALEEGLDLVEVNPKAAPPVCKLLDFSKYRYAEKKLRAQAGRWREEKTFAEAWRRYRRFASREENAELPVFDLDEESPGEYERLTLQTREDTRTLLVCEKTHVQTLLDTWTESLGSERASVAHRTKPALAWVGPLASTWAALTLKEHAESLRVPLAFFGDLDPQALHAFATLRSGGRDAVRRGKRAAVPIVWLGLDSEWLEWVCQGFGTQDVPVGMTIRLNALDQEYWQMLKHHVPDVVRLVGRRGCAMLDSGVKVEADALRGEPFLREMERRIVALTGKPRRTKSRR
jgi:translation initiation factor IF-3-like protein